MGSLITVRVKDEAYMMPNAKKDFPVWDLSSRQNLMLVKATVSDQTNGEATVQGNRSILIFLFSEFTKPEVSVA